MIWVKRYLLCVGRSSFLIEQMLNHLMKLSWRSASEETALPLNSEYACSHMEDTIQIQTIGAVAKVSMG